MATKTEEIRDAVLKTLAGMPGLARWKREQEAQERERAQRDQDVTELHRLEREAAEQCPAVIAECARIKHEKLDEIRTAYASYHAAELRELETTQRFDAAIRRVKDRLRRSADPVLAADGMLMRSVAGLLGHVRGHLTGAVSVPQLREIVRDLRALGWRPTGTDSNSVALYEAEQAIARHEAAEPLIELLEQARVDLENLAYARGGEVWPALERIAKRIPARCFCGQALTLTLPAKAGEEAA